MEKLKKFFEEKEKIIMAFLFGSFAKGKNWKNSDVDIAVYLKDYSENEIIKLWNELEDLLKKDVDLIILNTCKPLIAWEALRGEKILIKDHNLYLDLLLNVSSEAIDLQEFILDVYKMRKERIK